MEYLTPINLLPCCFSSKVNIPSSSEGREVGCKERPFTYTALSATWLPLTLSRGATVGGLSEAWENRPIPQAAEQNVASRVRRYTRREATDMNIALEDIEKAINPLATTSTQCGSQQSPIRGSCAATHPSLFSLVKSCSAPLYFPWHFAVSHFLTIFSLYDIKILFTIKIQY